jgi:hypothetical protein
MGFILKVFKHTPLKPYVPSIKGGDTEGVEGLLNSTIDALLLGGAAAFASAIDLRLYKCTIMRIV